ncbi:ATP-binding cassette domain-containing protein [Rapidithrix thailandica]|uniref:ATP-binding cassette domain-containing protein n=1 Tax=Rapidithrix thailandica TaxID=413964 RepID=A0AAW9S3G9_9BACT
MKIQLEGIGKRFGKEWIFRKFDYTFCSGRSYAITGSNGSGKTTLLRSIAGILNLNEGKIQYSFQQKALSQELLFKHLVLVGPYTDLIQEFTLREIVEFHNTFKPLTLPPKEFFKVLELEKHINKPIRNFSSGMKQKLKLGLAIFTNNRVILLDEPTTNLDKHNTDWYLRMISEHIRDQLIVVSSNQPVEYGFCQEVINLNIC